MKYLQNQESFSFNSTSSSLKIGLFSDDEYGGADGHNHARGQQNGYFEISLPPPPPTIPRTHHDDAKEEEFEFCFSFNSSSTLVDFPTTPKPSTTTIAASQTADVVDKKYNHHNKINNSINYGRIFQRTSCPQGFISPYVLRTSIEGQQVTRLRTFDTNQQELIRNRSSVVIRKVMVKLRSIKCMLPSSLHAKSLRLQPPSVDKVNKKNNKTCTDMQRDGGRIATKIDKNSCSQNPNSEEEKSRRMMNLDGFRKMVDVIMRRSQRWKEKRGSQSCPASIKSSPMHHHPSVGEEPRSSFYSKHHSIQAAIAHCKKSFGKST